MRISWSTQIQATGFVEAAKLEIAKIATFVAWMFAMFATGGNFVVPRTDGKTEVLLEMQRQKFICERFQ